MKKYILVVISILIALGTGINALFSFEYGFTSGDLVGSLLRMGYSIPFMLLAMYLANIFANLRDGTAWYIFDLIPKKKKK